MPIGAAVGTAVAGVAGAAISAGATSSAASKQAAATNEALQFQTAETAYNNANQQPFVNAGLNGLSRQQDLIDNYQDNLDPYLNALSGATPGNMTQSDLESTPGYAFTLSQGLKSTQSAAAARGLGVSGAALKAAASYATGLSDQTYNTRFNQQQQQYADASNNLSAASGLYNGLIGANQSAITTGENAAVGAGTVGQAAANNTGNLLTAQGNSQAASTIAGGNALAGGVNSVANAANQYYQQQQLQKYLDQGGSQYGYAPGYNANSLNAIDNGRWTAGDAATAASYNDLAGY